jgi:hypothetical protein
MQIPISNSGLDWFNGEEFSKSFDMLSDSTKKAIGTKIPFVSYSGGKFIINPSTISIQTFQKMVEKDNIIGACLEYHMASICATIGDYYHPNRKIQKHVRRQLKKFNGGFLKFLKQCLTKLWAGFSISELLIQYCDNIGSHYLSDALWLPPTTLLYSVDNDGFLERKGVHQYVINAAIPSYANVFSYGAVADSQYNIDPLASDGNYMMPVRTIAYNPVGLVDIDLDDVIVCSNDGVSAFSNPYGYSMLQRVYTLYLLKYGIMQAMAVAYDRRATPLLAVYCSAEQPLEMAMADGSRKTVDAITAAANALKDLNSSAAFILPGLKDKIYNLDVLETEADFTGFIEGIRMIDAKIMQGLKVPESIFSAEQGASYALGNTQGSTYQTFCDSMREELLSTVMEQFIKKNIELAFTEDEYDDDLGYFGVKLSNIDDKLKYSQLFQTLNSFQIFGGTDLEDANYARETVGVPEVEQSAFTKIQEVTSGNTETKPVSGERSPSKKEKISEGAGDPYSHRPNVQ